MKTPHTIELLPPLKVSAFAVLIGWHAESVRRALRSGRLKGVKVGDDWRIPQDEAARALNEGLPSKPSISD